MSTLSISLGWRSVVSMYGGVRTMSVFDPVRRSTARQVPSGVRVLTRPARRERYRKGTPDGSQAASMSSVLEQSVKRHANRARVQRLSPFREY